MTGVPRDLMIPRGSIMVHPDTVHCLLCGDEPTRARVAALLTVASESPPDGGPPFVRIPGLTCLCGRVTP